MDSLLLDGHLGIVFALALAVLRVEAPAISALHGEALVDALKARSPEIARVGPRLPEIARESALHGEALVDCPWALS